MIPEKVISREVQFLLVGVSRDVVGLCKFKPVLFPKSEMFVGQPKHQTTTSILYPIGRVHHFTASSQSESVCSGVLYLARSIARLEISLLEDLFTTQPSQTCNESSVPTTRTV